MIGSYRAAQFAARAAAGTLSDAAVRAILRELAREMAVLQAEMGRLSIATPAARVRALEASALLLQRMQRRLTDVLTRAVTERRAVAFDEIAAVWQEAAIRTARVRGVPDALLGAVRQPPLTMLGAYESLGGASRTWRTALHTVVEAARVDLDSIVREGIAAQLHPEEIAKRLRPYVLGAEPFHTAFPEEVVSRVQDLRRAQPPGMRDAGRKMAHNARRIAYSEVHNARAEAETTHFALDPMVEAVQWTLSPYRGQVVVPDVCDMLAQANWYGLGPGLFPVTKVPPSPHPFDRCERVPVTRRADQAADPKPNPGRVLRGSDARIPSEFAATTSEAHAARVLRDAERAVSQGEAIAGASGLSTLVSSGLASAEPMVADIRAFRAQLAAAGGRR